MGLKPFLKECRVFLREFAVLCVPKTKSEKILFLIVSIGYLAFSPFFIFNTFVLDHPESCCDLFLGYDSQQISRRGFANITAHPFMAFFSVPPAYFGDILAIMFGYKAKTFFLALLTTYLIVQSQVIVRRYLVNIIGLGAWGCNVLAIFFAFFASNFALSMTFDSFSFSFFLLSASTYYFSSKLKDGEEISLTSGILLSLSLGGITITNVAKGFSAYFFDRIPLKKILKKQTIILASFIAMFAGLSTILFYFFNRERIMDIFVRYERWSRPEYHLPEETLQTVISRFFGAPILLPDFNIIDRDFPDGPFTVLTNYDGWWQYGFTLIIMTFLLWSFVTHFKNKLVLFISLNFLMDVVIHIVFEYGLGESFIYAGHWIFSFPILLGWLIKDQNKKIGYTITFIILAFSLIALCNNAFRFYEIYHDFALKYYGT